MNIAVIILFVLLALIIYQDVKDRLVHVSLLIALTLVGLIVYYLKGFDFVQLLKSVIFISLNIAGLVVYFSIKNQQIINPVNKVIGIGDILFFYAVIPLFFLNNYIYYYVSGLIFSIFLHIFFNKKKRTIPLAAYLSIFLIIVLLYDFIVSQSDSHKQITLVFL